MSGSLPRPLIAEIDRLTPDDKTAAADFIGEFAQDATYDDPVGVLDDMLSDDSFRGVFRPDARGERTLVATAGFQTVEVNAGKFGNPRRGTLTLSAPRHFVVHPDYRDRGIGATLAGHTFVEATLRSRGTLEGVVAATIDPTRKVSETLTKTLLGGVHSLWELDLTPGLHDFTAAAFRTAGDLSPDVQILVFNFRKLYLAARSGAAMMHDVLKAKHLWMMSNVLADLDAEAAGDLKGLAMLDRATLIKYGLVRGPDDRGPNGPAMSLFGRYSRLLQKAEILDLSAARLLKVVD